MAERVIATVKKSEEKQKCSNFCKQNPGLNSSGFSADRILQLQRTAGNQAVQRLIKSKALQAKLRIGQPNDIYEQEADRVAEQVMRMPDPVLQRKYAKCNKDEKKVLQSKESPGQVPVTQEDVPPIVQEVLRSPGQPLDAATRDFMETRFGNDFSGVRVHTDSKAAESARAVNALAFTVGKDVVFRERQYMPNTAEGKGLLAHELMHTVQQDHKVHLFQRKAVPNSEKIRANLSYGLFDWAITEKEVHEVLMILKPLSDETLKDTLAVLEPKLMDRIFSKISEKDAATEIALLDRIRRLRTKPEMFVHNTELGGLFVGNFDFHFSKCSILVWVWVKFKFTKDINFAEQEAFKKRFKVAVNNVWEHTGYSLSGTKDCTCGTIPIEIHVEESTSSFYHKLVDVERKTDEERRPKVISDININLFSSDNKIAHEFGHVLGLYDEYDGGFFENLMFWHKNQNDPNALMSGGTELRPRYFEHYQKQVESTAPKGCKYTISSPKPPVP